MVSKQLKYEKFKLRRLIALRSALAACFLNYVELILLQHMGARFLFYYLKNSPISVLQKMIN
jgi:hypothetical protein